MNKEYAKFLLAQTVSDYNNIAEKFSSTRRYLSEDILELKKYVEEGDSVLDLGCGNGRLLQMFDDIVIDYTGGDSSEALVKIAQRLHPERNFVVLNPIQLDFEENSFDVVFCLSVFHHIPDTEFRLDYLRQIFKVLKPGGYLLLTVWNLWKKSDTFWQIIKNGIFHPKLDLDDFFIPFKDGTGKTLASRYIHCFTKSELEKLFLESGFDVRLIETQPRGKNAENENFLIVAKK